MNITLNGIAVPVVNIALTLYAGTDVYFSQKEMGINTENQSMGPGRIITIAVISAMIILTTVLICKFTDFGILLSLVCSLGYYFLTVIALYFVVEHLATFNPTPPSKDGSIRWSKVLVTRVVLALLALLVCSYELSEFFSALFTGLKKC